MKFSAQFEASQFPEWAKRYVRYVSIKQHIHDTFPPQQQHSRHSADDLDGEIDVSTETPVKPLFSPPSSSSSHSLLSWAHSHYGSVSSSDPSPHHSSSSSLLSLDDRGDIIMTKLLSELHKVDNFYRAVETELDSGFNALKAQINIVVAERQRGQPPKRSKPDASSATTSSAPSFSTPTVATTNGISHAGGDVHSSTPDLTSIPSGSPRSDDGGSGSQPNSIPGPSTLHHSYSTGAMPRKVQLPDAMPLMSSTSSTSNGSAHPIKPSHAPSSYSYTSKQYHLHLPNHSSSSSSSSTAGAHEPSFMSHLLHPLHPELHPRPSHDGMDLTSALLPLKSTFIHLLRRMTMLIHYVDINLYALKRLLSFFESRSGLHSTAAKFERLMKTKHVCTSRKLEDELIPSTYSLFADYYEGGDVERARVFLLAHLSEADYDRIDTFFLGLKIGVIAMLLLWNVMLMIRPTDSLVTLQSLSVYAPVYRCTGLLVLFLWLWGLAVLIFDTYRISYVFVFQLNPRNRLTHFSLFNEAANLSVVYLVNVLLLISHYEQALDAHVSSHIYPISLLTFFVLKLFTPSDFLSYWHARSTLLTSLASVAAAPFGAVTFRDTYIGDVLTSMVKVLVDVEFSCLLIVALLLPSQQATVTGTASMLIPFISVAPLWFRFMQCLRRYYDTKQRWPHLLNALKYAVAHSVVIVSVFHPAFSDHHSSKWETFRLCWLLSTVASSLYTFAWDLTQDWGLLQLKDGGGLLRPTLLFGSRYFYYWAMFSNFFLRFCWVLTLVPMALFEGLHNTATAPSSFFSYLLSSPSILITLLTAAELLRRFQWTLLRVEWEQIVKGSGFRMSYYAPMMFHQQQDGGGQGGAGGGDRGGKSSASVVLEVVLMVVLVLIVAVLGAIL